MERWHGRIAIVTGANSGIGKAVARILVENGMIVIGADLKSDAIKVMKDELKSSNGQLHDVICDVTNEENIKSTVKYVKEKFGGTDVLVNCAGIALPYCPLSSFDTSVFKKIFETNVIGLSIFTREVLQDMKNRSLNDGHIFNICSVTGQQILEIPGLYVYSSAKHAVRVLSEGLRRELRDAGTKIKVTNISPGLVDTAIFRADMTESEINEALKVRPILQTRDIADAILYSLQTPPHVQVHEITIKPVGEKS